MDTPLEKIAGDARVVDGLTAQPAANPPAQAGRQWPALATDPGYGGTLPSAPPAVNRPAYQADGTPSDPEASR
jgi:hypothetical protein